MATGEAIGRLLAPARFMKVVTRIKRASHAISDYFGWSLGTPGRTPGASASKDGEDDSPAAALNYGGRSGAYDVFNYTRTVPVMRAPNQPSFRLAPQKIGSVPFTFPRFAETIPLVDEDMYSRRRPGSTSAELDEMGEEYITRQADFLNDRYGNLIEILTMAMLRGSLTYSVASAGDATYIDFSGLDVTLDYRVPSGNKGQLDVFGLGAIIDAPWSTISTKILAHLMAVNKASLQLTGYPITQAICGSDVWNYMIANTQIINAGGNYNSPFEYLRQDKNGNFKAKVRGVPWMEFSVIDTGLDVGATPTYKTMIAADHISLFPEPSPEWCQMLYGSEIVTEGPGVGATRSERYGFYTFGYSTFDPSGWNIMAGFNGLPALYVPGAVFDADVTP